MTQYHLGVDSTDSADLGMCTTYLGACLIDELEAIGLSLTGPPELIRLNPNVPWKTRGNGAVCLRLEGETGLDREIIRLSSDIIERLSVFEDPQANPGLAILMGHVPDILTDLYHEALHRIIDIERAVDAAEMSGVELKGWKNGRGKIGALSAIGADLSKGHSYEAILYRSPSIKRRERSLDLGSLREAVSRHSSTFFNVSGDGTPLCVPRSPCPVILGIRGMDMIDTLECLSEVESPSSERWVLWRTNQHTDAHIEYVEDLQQAIAHSSVSFVVFVRKKPEYLEGGHLRVPVRDIKGKAFDCMAYEPTKGFRKKLSILETGDRIRVWGSVKKRDTPPPTINVEKIEVLELVTIEKFKYPRCPQCGGATGSMGSGQGLRCKKCGHRDDDMLKISILVDRDLECGLIEPPPQAWRHLFKPSCIPAMEERPYGGPFHGKGHPGDLK